MHEIDRSGEPVFELRDISHSYGRNKVIFDVNLSRLAGRGRGAGRRQRRRQVDAAQDLRGLPAADVGHAALHGQGRALQNAGRRARDGHRGGLPGSRHRRPAQPLAELLSRQGDRAEGRAAEHPAAEPDAAGGAEGDQRARPHPHPLRRRAGMVDVGRRTAVGGDHPRDPFRRAGCSCSTSRRRRSRCARRATCCNRSAARASRSSACSTSTTT